MYTPCWLHSPERSASATPRVRFWIQPSWHLDRINNQYQEGFIITPISYNKEAFELWRKELYDELLQWMDQYDSFEDWPWPLIYKEIVPPRK